MAAQANRNGGGWQRWRPVLIVGAVGLAFGVLIFSFQHVFAPLAVALALAYILNPVMRWGTRHRIPRGVMATLLFLGVLVIVGVVTLVALPPLVAQLYGFGVSVVGEPPAEKADATADETGAAAAPEEAGQGAVRTDAEGRRYLDLNRNAKWDRGYVPFLIEQVREVARRGTAEDAWYARALESLDWSPEMGRQLFEKALPWLRRAAANFLGFLWDLQGFVVSVGLTAFYLFFLLMNFDRVVTAVRDRLPGRHKGRIEGVARKVDAAVSAFFRGRLLVCLIVGALTALGLALLGVPYWYLLGVVTGVAGIVPYLPIFVGLVPSMMVAWSDTGNPWIALGAIGVFVIVQGMEGWILTPWIQGRAVGLHPVTLMLALLLGYEILGLFGLIAAAPLAATVKILAKEFVLPEVDRMAKDKHVVER